MRVIIRAHYAAFTSTLGRERNCHRRRREDRDFVAPTQVVCVHRLLAAREHQAQAQGDQNPYDSE
jgi:hypothetical protein